MGADTRCGFWRVAEPLAIDEYPSWDIVAEAREKRSFGANPLHGRREQPPVRLMVIAGEPSDLSNELFAIRTPEGPLLRPSTPLGERSCLQDLKPGKHLTGDHVYELGVAGELLDFLEEQLDYCF